MTTENQQLAPRVLASKTFLRIVNDLERYQASITNRTEISGVRSAIGWITRLEQWFFLHNDDEVRDLNASFLSDSLHRKASGCTRSPLLDTPASRAIDEAVEVLHNYVCRVSRLDEDPDFERAYLSF